MAGIPVRHPVVKKTDALITGIHLLSKEKGSNVTLTDANGKKRSL